MLQHPCKFSITHNINICQEVVKITLGERIKNERLKINMSRIELSRLTGVPLRTLDDWENGRRNATHIQVIKICDILNIDIHDYI